MPETPLSDLSAYSAKPTIRVDGEALAKVTELALALELRESEGGMSALELRLSNVASDPEGGSDFAFEDDGILRLGAALAIYSGDETAPQEIFRGAITGLEAEFPEKAPAEIVVLAEDVFQRARMKRRTALHENVSIRDVASDLASQLNLTPVVTGFSDTIGTWMQLNESDLAFLRRILERYDGDLQVVGTELHVSPRGDVQRGTIELELHGQLRRARVLADLAHQVNEVTVTGWDPVQGKRVRSTSTGAHAGPGAGRTGAEQISDALGARSEHIGYLAVSRDAEAQALADAAFDRRARRFVRVEGTAEGNAALRVGAHLRLKGLGPRFDNVYYVTHACHRWDVANAYETDFEAECAFLGGG
jgi:Bacteriophage probable baseplate hub protein